MWKCFIKNNYLFLVNGTKEFRRLKCNVEVTKKGDDYFFTDLETTYKRINIDDLVDENENTYTEITFDEFITLNTGCSSNDTNSSTGQNKYDLHLGGQFSYNGNLWRGQNVINGNYGSPHAQIYVPRQHPFAINADFAGFNNQSLTFGHVIDIDSNVVGLSVGYHNYGVSTYYSIGLVVMRLNNNGNLDTVTAGEVTFFAPAGQKTFRQSGFKSPIPVQAGDFICMVSASEHTYNTTVKNSISLNIHLQEV